MHCAKMFLLYIQLTCFAYIVNFINTDKIWKSCLILWRQPRRKPKPHDDVIKWKHFPRYWPFVREIHRSPVNFPHKGQWRGALMFTLICARMNGWVNNREAGDLRRYLAHYDVIVMCKQKVIHTIFFVICTIYNRALFCCVYGISSMWIHVTHILQSWLRMYAYVLECAAHCKAL